MAIGDLTTGTITYCNTEAAITTAINAINLAATTDFLFVIPANNGWLVFKVQRAAA